MVTVEITPVEDMEPIGKGSVPIRIEVAAAPDEDSMDVYSEVETRGAADLRGGHRDGVRGGRPDRAPSRGHG